MHAGEANQHGYFKFGSPFSYKLRKNNISNYIQLYAMFLYYYISWIKSLKTNQDRTKQNRTEQDKTRQGVDQNYDNNFRVMNEKLGLKVQEINEEGEKVVLQ